MIAEIQDYAIILLDVDGTILSWNAGVQKIKGYSESEILGQNFRIFYLPSDRQSGLPEQLIAHASKAGQDISEDVYVKMAQCFGGAF